MNKVSSFFMVIGLFAALHVNAQGGNSFPTFNGDGQGMMQGPPPGGFGGGGGQDNRGGRPMGPPPGGMQGGQPGGMMPPMHHEQSFGTNAAVLALKGGKIELPGGTITTDTLNANAVVADGGIIGISNAIIRCKGNMSRGLYAVNGGTIVARNLNIVTEGNNSSVIATDRGGGTVSVEGGDYTARGKDCAVCYSTGTITATGITGCSELGEVAVVEGDNIINISDSQLETGDDRWGMLILQSGSGDAEGFNGRININRGSIRLTQDKIPLVKVTTNTTGTVTLNDVELDVPSGLLMHVGYNKRWDTRGATGNLRLTTSSTHTYSGYVGADKTGTINVTVDSGVTWNLTHDVKLNRLTIAQGATVNTNGHKLKYDSLDNKGNLNN